MLTEGLIESIERTQSWPRAISLCAELRGYDLDKQACADIKIDRARWSRIRNGTEGIKWSQLKEYMGHMENFVPVLWMFRQCGFDLRAARPIETELERELREAREELDRERLKNAALVEALRGNK